MTEAQTIQDIVKSQQVFDIHGNPAIALPEGYELADLEHFLPAPRRIRQNVKLLSADSFIQYCAKFATDASVILADANQTKLTAQLDYHADPATPDWCSHSAVYQCVKSKPWKIWEEHNEKAMGQEAFAEFLEDRAGDIITPTGAELLEIATKFQVIRKAVFGSAIRLATGEFQFNYSDENDKGTIEVPEVITLGLAPFHNGESYEVQARLRYRLREGKLAFTFKLINPERVIEDAFNSVVESVKAGVTEATVYDAQA